VSKCKSQIESDVSLLYVPTGDNSHQIDWGVALIWGPLCQALAERLRWRGLLQHVEGYAVLESAGYPHAECDVSYPLLFTLEEQMVPLRA